MMEHCRETYCDAVGKVFGSHVLADPTAVIFSSATGDRLETIGADYFWTNSRGPVRFQQAIQTLNKTHPNATFLEIGPHPVLTSYLSSLVEDSVVACPLRRLNLKKPEKDVELRAFLGALGQLATARHHVDYSLLGASDAHILRKTPAYPFQPKSIPLMLPSSETKRFTQPRNGPLNFPELRVNSQTHPSLADHLIKSTPIMPATGYVEMVRILLKRDRGN
jgi:acyl transferase domain-containing protein